MADAHSYFPGKLANLFQTLDDDEFSSSPAQIPWATPRHERWNTVRIIAIYIEVLPHCQEKFQIFLQTYPISSLLVRKMSPMRADFHVEKNLGAGWL